MSPSSFLTGEGVEAADGKMCGIGDASAPPDMNAEGCSSEEEEGCSGTSGEKEEEEEEEDGGSSEGWSGGGSTMLVGDAGASFHKV